MPGPAPTPSAVRVWKHVEVGAPDKCWLWIGAKQSRRNPAADTYGHLGGDTPRSTIGAHCAAYISAYGPIPDGYEVDHLCKVTLCCNPAHLEAVPGQVNNFRSLSYAALNKVKTHCPQGHAYDAENTGYRKPPADKASPGAGMWRYCRACAREDRRKRMGYDPARYRRP